MIKKKDGKVEMEPSVRRIYEAKFEAEKSVKVQELELVNLLMREKNYEYSSLQKELFELLKAKYVVDLELARWEVKQCEEQLNNCK